jgi:ribosomal protein L7/L12
MNDSLLAGGALGALAVFGVLVAVRASTSRHARAVARLEAKVDALLEHAGIRFDPYAKVPPPVIEALQRGQKIEAIRQYRLATGIGLKEAKERIDEIGRRAAPPV